MSVPSAAILMYHRVADDPVDPWHMCVKQEHFASQMRSLRELGETVSLPEFAARQRSGNLPERSIVVTFDDGYLDNLEQAFPVLKEHQVPATFFVATANIDGDGEFWWDRLATLLLEPENLPAKLHLELSSGPRDWELGAARDHFASDRERDRSIQPWEAAPGTRLHFFRDVWRALWPLPTAERALVIDVIAAWCGVNFTPSSDRRTLSSAELETLSKEELVTIGGHTVSHPALSSRDVAEQAREIREGKARLEAITGVSVTCFAFPHGKYNDPTLSILEQSGFSCAVTGVRALARADTPPLLLPRFAVANVPGETLAEDLAAAFSA